MRYKVLTAALIAMLCMLSIGCEREWYFTLTNPDAKHPEFCISRYADCKGSGITIAGLNIDEVNEKGELIRTMWVITPETRSELKRITYGIVPEGYKETAAALPIEIGKIYSVLGKYYFKFIRNNGSVRAEIYNTEEFNKKFKWAKK